MKMGFRTPSIKKSISARTTGRATRALKSCYTPTYGKRGTGKYKNPKKSAYNKVYHETTISPIPHSTLRHKRYVSSAIKANQQKQNIQPKHSEGTKGAIIVLLIIFLVFIIGIIRELFIIAFC